MLRNLLSLLLCVFASTLTRASDIRGLYLETRTCQVYTGPCFANAEMGLTGKEAIMAWSVQRGKQDGVDLTGLNVVVAIEASDTLGFEGINNAKQLKSVILVDDRANETQRDALIAFAKEHSGKAGASVVRVDSMPIEMSLDTSELTGSLQAGKSVKVTTRRAKPTDCICSNEIAYYPPLTQLKHFAPGVTVEGEFNGRGLSTRWSAPNSRSAYMATFAY